LLALYPRCAACQAAALLALSSSSFLSFSFLAKMTSAYYSKNLPLISIKINQINFKNF